MNWKFSKLGDCKIGENSQNGIIEAFSIYSESSRYEADEECRNPNLAKCGGEAQHLEKLGFRVLRDSRMFRAPQQGAKHLALTCS